MGKTKSRPHKVTDEEMTTEQIQELEHQLAAFQFDNKKSSQNIRVFIESLLTTQTTEFADLLKKNHDWIWGTICKKCSGTGMDEQENCSQCRATGIDNWNVEGFIEQFLKTHQSQ